MGVARALDDNSDGVGGEWSLIKAQQWQPIQYTSLFDDDDNAGDNGDVDGKLSLIKAQQWSHTTLRDLSSI